MEEKFVVEEDAVGGVVPLEVGGDYTLPDYMPEVRRLLRVDSRAAITGTYPNGDKTEVGGDCHYDMLYTDEEGHIVSAGLDGTFECVIPYREVEQGQMLLTIENVVCRPAGPRRVSMKTSLALRPSIIERKTMEDIEEGTQGEKLELLRTPLINGKTVVFSKEEILLQEKMKAEPNSTMLSCDGKVLVREVRCLSGEAEVRGEVWANILLSNQENTPYTVKVKIPFTEIVKQEDVTPLCKGVAWGKVRNLASSLTQEEHADIISMDVLLDIRGMAMENETITPAVDLYALEYPEKVSVVPLSTRWYPAVTMGNFTVDGMVNCDGMGIPAGEHPVDCRGEVISATGVENGREIVVEGEVRLHPIFTYENSYISTTATLPYKVRLQGQDSLPSGSSLNVYAECVGCHVRIDGARMAVDMELFVTAIASLGQVSQVVEQVELDKAHPYMDEEGEIFAIYLDGKESLWDVGKRYHTSLEELQSGNGLPDEILEHPQNPQLLDGLARLLIER